jgi:hypothetical protein
MNPLAFTVSKSILTENYSLSILRSALTAKQSHSLLVNFRTDILTQYSSDSRITVCKAW